MVLDDNTVQEIASKFSNIGNEQPKTGRLVFVHSRPNAMTKKRIFRISDWDVKAQRFRLEAVCSDYSFMATEGYSRTRLRALDEPPFEVGGDTIDAFFKQILNPEDYKFVGKIYKKAFDKYEDMTLNYEDIQGLNYAPVARQRIKQNMQFVQDNKFNEKGSKNMIDKLMNQNKKAAKSAATMAATRAVTDVLTEKVVALVPEDIGLFLQTPLGTLVLANAANVAKNLAADSVDHKTFNAISALTEAMTVNAMADVLAQFDLPGLLKGALAIPEVAGALETWEEKDEV